ncbi:1,4-alpha-glucan branching protein domain-containing protein [Jatrophihabitans lederbergiae]|uniref:1,4-alpha-glucan branching protein domain-containing protein n=1 Tax=Jatrophihabitans lederbergiae TaxID=3075547 RepID=A0ABU2J5Q6_9ACTN|nr:1,4-alpha-glucan branching protein domain-containing protein [Jatrophihabitans sp. DSM 44399]MDT0259849.1 1,4-alpha-glucan branching protein domain-containing protein [Jatrophihabitans sp. DSM 44399]
MKPVGTFCLVLHTHLPWVAHNGTWPVGEEWLHQAFTGSWRRVLRVFESLAEQGYSDVATLGVTPIVAAMMDDPYCLDEIHSWAGRWQLRAEELSARPEFGELAGYERRQAVACLDDVERRWLTGGLSGVLRPLLDAGVLEVLSGPATHPFQPLLTDRFADAQLATGLADTRLRLGTTSPTGIWAPECGYASGLEDRYAAHGVSHFLVDGPAVDGDTGFGRPVGESDVVAFARDLPVSYRIWSARAGYPGGESYRDFHTFDHASGFRPSRVTGMSVSSEAKQPWDPASASAAVLRDAEDFVGAVLSRLTELSRRHGRDALVVAAFDTELFGHWWYEGPEFLETVLRLLPRAGVRLSTLRGAMDAGLVADPIRLPSSSWGAGKDWRVWDNDEIRDLNDEIAQVQQRLYAVLDGRFARRAAAAVPRPSAGRDAVADQLAREALLVSASDWAFMVTRDSAADYGRQRARGHAERFHALADAMESGDARAAAALAERLRRIDGPFGHVDARLF